MSPVSDTFSRPLGNLRISVTDRCNLRCAYCMPEEEYVWLPRDDLLSFEEIARLARVFTSLGVETVRLTGGEPLLRRDLPELVRLLRGDDRIRDLAMTTNGLLLAEHAADLHAAGLGRVTISLDTLHADRFRALTRRDGLDRVLAGVAAARAAGFRTLKVDTVVLRGVNDDELVPLVEWSRAADVEVRFIEYMDVGGATRWSMRDVVSRAEMLATFERAYGPVAPIEDASRAPADRFMLADGLVFGIIASTTAPFCASCDRSRLTADGQWYDCLYAPTGTDLRTPLRAGADPEELARIVTSGWRARTARGAEERLAHHRRSALAGPEALRADPHLEMHTRGG